MLSLRRMAAAFALFTLCLFLLAPSVARAQQTLGGIVGTVTDPSGSVVPGVQVKAVSDDTKLTRTAQSSAQGSYTLNDLPIGKYTLTFTRDGFRARDIPASWSRLTVRSLFRRSLRWEPYRIP